MSDAYENVTWYDARDFGLRGMGWQDEPRQQPFDRFPASMETQIEERLWTLSTQPAGVYVDFAGSVERLYARWTLLTPLTDHERTNRTPESGLDCHARDANGAWRWAGSRSPWNAPQCDGSLTFGPVDGADREYRVYLPISARVGRLEIGAAAPLRPVDRADERPPIAYYGTSIVHGAHVSRPGMPHACQMARMLDREVYNLGFAGRAWLELAVADALGRLSPVVFMIDCLPNNTPEQIAERLPAFLERLRELRPDTPFLLVEDREFGGAHFQPSRTALRLEKNAAMHKVISDLRQAGMTGLHTAEHPDWFGGDGDGTTDGSHPNDLGAWRMAEALAPMVQRVIDM